MALDDRTIDFPVAGGLNDGADELQNNSPLLSDAVDCIFRKDGRVERRKGTLAAAAAASAFPNSVFARKGRAFTHSEGGFIARPVVATFGAALNDMAPRPCDVATDALVRSSADPFDPDVAALGGYLCVVWASLPMNTSAVYSAASTVYARVLDEATGAVVLDVTLATNATNPRVVQLGTRFLVTAVTGAIAMGAWTFDTTSPSSSWTAPFALHDAAVSGYDLCVAADPGATTAAYAAIYDAAGVTLKRIDASTLAIISQVKNALTGVQAIGVCHVPGSTSRVWVATFRDVAANQIALWFSNATTLAAFTAAGTQNVTNYATDFGAGRMADWRVAVEQKSLDQGFSNDRLIVAWSWAVGRDDTGAAVGYAVTGTYHSKCVESCLASQTGSFSSSLATSPGYELVSKPFLLAVAGSDGVCTFVMKWGTSGARTLSPIVDEWLSLQSAGLLVAREGITTASRHVPVARLFNNGCASLGYNPFPLALTKSGFKPRRLTSLVRSSVTADQVITAAETYTRAPLLRNISGLDPVDNGIDIARVGFRSACRPLRWINAAGSVSAHGGFHAACDGVRGIENSIHSAPERPRRELGVGTGAGWFTTPTSNRNIVAGWVFYDSDGLEHRSALSAPASSGTNAAVTPLRLHISPPPVTAAGRLILRLWATGDIAAGAPADVYYLCFEGDALTLPATSGAVGWVTVDPAAPDTTDSELPYTSGGVLPSEPPPALRDLAAWQDVLVGIDAGDRNLLWYTKPLEPGIAPEWSAALTVRLPSDGGDVVALMTVDDKLVCLKERAVYYVVGSTRDRLGQGNDPIAVRVASDVGCLGRHTTALVPDGLLFVASNGRGLCLLDRGMSLRRMRQAEDRFAEYGPTIHSAVVVPHESCVRWATTGGLVVSLDYEHGAISRFTAYRGGQHQAVIGGRVWLLQAAGTLTREALEGAGEVVADQAPYWSVTTAWIKLAGLAGFQRVRRLVLLSTQPERDKGAVGLTAQVAYDYDPTPAGSAAWEPLQWGPGNGGRQVMWHLPRQKCTSIRFTVAENAIGIPPASPVYTSVLLSQLSLRCGVKQSPTKNLAATSRSPSGGGV